MCGGAAASVHVPRLSCSRSCFRYLLGWPTGWAFELSIITWLWVVLWGAAFVVGERDEIRFDIVYGTVFARRAPAPARWSPAWP